MSNAPQPAPRFVRFDGFTVDLRLGELRYQGTKVRLAQQPFQVLAMLLERPGDLVTREELRQRLWASDTFVDFDHGLNVAINRLRERLRDDAEQPRYIETIPRRGYRFIAQTEVAFPDRPAEPDTETPQTAGAWRSIQRWALLASALLLATIALAIIGWVWRARNTSDSTTPPIRSIAVLPLTNLSGDPSQDYFADGMTDELISDLAQISALRVISRTSVMQYKNARKSLRDIGKELNVDAVVEGSVERSGGRVRVSAQLIRASSDVHLWARTYERDLEDVIALQDEVAGAIAGEIRISVLPNERARLKTAQAIKSDAYESYLQGLYHIHKRTQDDLEKSSAYFQRAVELDPGYALAYAGLADSYALRGSLLYMALAPREVMPKSKAAALKALQLDDSLGEAYATLAYVETLYDWDWRKSAEDFKRAIALSPNYAQAHLWYAMHLAAIGRHNESIAEVKRARELDPLSLIINSSLGLMLYFDARYDEAIEQFHNVVELDPGFFVAHWELGIAYQQKGMYQQAVSQLQKAIELSPKNSAVVEALGEVDALSGRKLEAQAILRKLTRISKREFVSPYVLASLELTLGAKDEAFASLNKAYDQRDNNLIFLKIDPSFRSAHSDPQFRNLLQRIGLSGE